MSQTIEMMASDQVRSYLDKHKPDQYVLLDVRQDMEYENAHIPGAKLIPLGELADRIGELPHGKPLIVYCASGGRSMAAAALLDGQGRTGIVNMVGGMNAWEGHTAFGPMHLGMISFTGYETPEDVVRKAYGMEDRLQQFYVMRSDMAEDVERIELFMELAGFEDRHKQTLFRLFSKITGKDDLAQFEKEVQACAEDTVEGGVPIDEFLAEFSEAFDSDQGVLELAMMIEAQALDYYLRCAQRAKSEEISDVLQLLAREEKAHLKLLGLHMDRHLAR